MASMADSGQIAVMFQRLVIYHTGLLPESSGLDESASIEELCEHILYYYDHSVHGGDIFTGRHASDVPGQDHSTESAAKFVGLCTALRTLPFSLKMAMSLNGQDLEGRDDSVGSDTPASNASGPCTPTSSYPNTDQVHLSNSTLMFIALEEAFECKGLVAVAQIPRTRQKAGGSFRVNRTGDGDDNYQPSGADPHAIRTMIQHAHTTFCLLSGGSIHRRLLSFDESDLVGVKLGEQDAISAPTPKTRTGSGEGGFDGSETIAESMAAAEAVAQEDAAWRERWSMSPQSSDQLGMGEFDDASDLDGYNSAMNLLRISSTTRRNERDESGSYPGVAQLYDSRKRHRKLKDRMLSNRASAGLYDQTGSETDENIRQIEKEVLDSQDHIDSLLSVLPITSLRLALKEYYNGVILDAVQRRTFGGECVGRCIVELLPVPGTSSAVSHSYCPREATPSTVALLSRIVQLLLDDQSQDKDAFLEVAGMNTNGSRSSVLAISAFYYGHLLFSKTPPGPDKGSVHVSIEDASTIFRYLSLKQEQKTDIVSNIPDMPDLWMPQIFVPVSLERTREEVKTRVALLEFGDFGFLVFANDTAFTKLPTAEDMTVSGSSHSSALGAGIDVSSYPCVLETSSDLANALRSVSEQLQSNLMQLPSTLDYAENFAGEEGADIVFVDRLQGRLALYSRYNTSCGSLDDGEGVDVVGENGQVFALCDHKDFDCRHILASHLPLDIILALDDMMKEVIRSNQRQKFAESSRVIELCTFLPQGWVYARAHQHREMYCVFDPNLFVTLADVHKAAIGYRACIFGGALL
jgi:hypothetical protein